MYCVLASCRSPGYANPNAKDDVQSSIGPSMLQRTTDAPSRCLCHSASEISDYDGCMIPDQTKHTGILTVEYASDKAGNKRRRYMLDSFDLSSAPAAPPTPTLCGSEPAQSRCPALQSRPRTPHATTALKVYLSQVNKTTRSRDTTTTQLLPKSHQRSKRWRHGGRHD